MSNDETRNENLPTISEDRIIHGEILRCVDGHWSLRDGTAINPDTLLLAIGTTEALQHWDGQIPLEDIRKRPGEALPDVDELNAQIPRSEWKEGLDGQPRPPWQHAYVAYLVSVDDASLYTFVNGTIGARIAVERLQDKVKWMRALRGVNCAPLVRLELQADEDPLRPEDAAGVHYCRVASDRWWRPAGAADRAAQAQSCRTDRPAGEAGHDRRRAQRPDPVLS